MENKVAKRETFGRMLPFILFLFQLFDASHGASTTAKPLAKNKVKKRGSNTFTAQVKSPRLLDSGAPEGRSGLIKTKVTAEKFSNSL